MVEIDLNREHTRPDTQRLLLAQSGRTHWLAQGPIGTRTVVDVTPRETTDSDPQGASQSANFTLRQLCAADRRWYSGGSFGS
jgi:hypothetical protein